MILFNKPFEVLPGGAAVIPDDVEFLMGGTLLLLKRAGWETHYLNVSSGNCGSQKMGSEETARVRGEEAKKAAELLGATWHEGFSSDLEMAAATSRPVEPSGY